MEKEGGGEGGGERERERESGEGERQGERKREGGGRAISHILFSISLSPLVQRPCQGASV